jgi:hypothetical protein
MNNDNQPDQFDFILNPSKNKPRVINAGGSQNQRLMQVGVGAAILLIVLIIVMAVFSGSGSSNLTDLYKVAAAQQDLIAIAGDAKTNSQSSITLNNAATINGVMTSENKQTLTALAKLGQKSPAKSIKLYQSTKNIPQLGQALSGGTYDTTFNSLVTLRLSEYQSLLQTAYTTTKSTSTKKILSTFYEDEKLLATNLPKN